MRPPRQATTASGSASTPRRACRSTRCSAMRRACATCGGPCDSGLPVVDVYSFYLRPATDPTQFMPALELGAALGAKYALTMGDDPDWARSRTTSGGSAMWRRGSASTCAVEFAVMRPLASLPQAARLVGRERPRERGDLPRSGELRAVRRRRCRDSKRSTGVVSLRADLRRHPRTRRARSGPARADGAESAPPARRGRRCRWPRSSMRCPRPAAQRRAAGAGRRAARPRAEWAKMTAGEHARFLETYYAWAGSASPSPLLALLHEEGCGELTGVVGFAFAGSRHE